MSMLTIRNLSDATHARLKRRAAARGRSMEAEVRAILDETVARDDEPVDLFKAFRRFAEEARLTDAEVDVIFGERLKSTPRIVDFGDEP